MCWPWTEDQPLRAALHVRSCGKHAHVLGHLHHVHARGHCATHQDKAYSATMSRKAIKGTNTVHLECASHVRHTRTKCYSTGLVRSRTQAPTGCTAGSTVHGMQQLRTATVGNSTAASPKMHHAPPKEKHHTQLAWFGSILMIKSRVGSPALQCTAHSRGPHSMPHDTSHGYTQHAPRHQSGAASSQPAQTWRQ